MDEKIEFCVFVAKVINNNMVDDITKFQNILKNNMNIDMKAYYKENNEINNNQKKLNDLGIPSIMKTSSDNQKKKDSLINILTQNFNNEVDNNCESKLFIIKMDEYNKILDEFDDISIKNIIKFPKLDDYNLLSIKFAQCILTTEKYLKENSDKIGYAIMNKFKNNN